MKKRWEKASKSPHLSSRDWNDRKRADPFFTLAREALKRISSPNLDPENPCFLHEILYFPSQSSLISVFCPTSCWR